MDRDLKQLKRIVMVSEKTVSDSMLKNTVPSSILKKSDNKIVDDIEGINKIKNMEQYELIIVILVSTNKIKITKLIKEIHLAKEVGIIVLCISKQKTDLMVGVGNGLHYYSTESPEDTKSLLEMVADRAFEESIDKAESERLISIKNISNNVLAKDILTGLADRYALKKALEKSIRESHIQSKSFAVFFVNLCHVWAVNAELGVEQGDILLKVMASRILDTNLQAKLVARYGGCGFVIILKSHLHLDDLKNKMNILESSLSKSVILSAHRYKPKVNIGSVIYPDQANDAQELIDKAYTAAYQAAKNNQAIQFYEDRENGFNAALLLENDLITGLKNKEFKLLYQPQIDARSCKVLGAEALIRWDNPRFGEILPDFFIPAAEKTGLVTAIGEWVLEQVCLKIQQWLKSKIIDDTFFVSINVSFKQLEKNGMFKFISKLIEKYHIPNHMLQIELTESAIIDTIEHGGMDLNNLKKSGVVIALDDFGTGYSSLSYLNNLPIDIVKIDRSFIAHTDEETTQMVIRSIINLAHNLRMTVTAEGVETEVQKNWLMDNHCDRFQGYYFGRPLTESTFLSLLEK